MRVNFYATLRAVVGQKSIDLSLPEGTTVCELAHAVAVRWPMIADQMVDGEGEVSRRVHIMIGGRNSRWLPDGNATILIGGDVIDIFPPTAGG